MLAGGKYNCGAANIWSCGVLLHYMLTEELPDVATLSSSACARAFPLELKGVSAECRDLLRGMLQPNTRKRADAWWIMNHPWFQMDCPEVSHATYPAFPVPASWPCLTVSWPLLTTGKEFMLSEATTLCAVAHRLQNAQISFRLGSILGLLNHLAHFSIIYQQMLQAGRAWTCACSAFVCSVDVPRAAQGLVDVDTELLIMSEEGMLNGFCEQSEAELTSALRRAQQLRSPPPKPILIPNF